MARKLACLFYRLIKHGRQYVDKGMGYDNVRPCEQQIRSLMKRAQQFGFQVVAKGPPRVSGERIADAWGGDDDAGTSPGDREEAQGFSAADRPEALLGHNWKTHRLHSARDDGDVRAGVASPNPRFTDNNSGTVTDNLTGLVWIKNTNAFGEVS